MTIPCQSLSVQPLISGHFAVPQGWLFSGVQQFIRTDHYSYPTMIASSLSSEILNTSSTYCCFHILLLLMLVCSFSLLSLFFSRNLAVFLLTFSFSFWHLPVQPYLFLSYLMIIFYVVKKFFVIN